MRRHGTVTDELGKLEAWANELGWTIGETDIFEDFQGIIGSGDWTDQVIRLSPDLPPAFRLQVLAHELGHVVLKHGIPGVGRDPSQDALDQEHQADNWAIALLKPLGFSVARIKHHDHDEVDGDNPAHQFYQDQNQYAHDMGANYWAALWAELAEDVETHSRIPAPPWPGWEYRRETDPLTGWPFFRLVKLPEPIEETHGPLPSFPG